jgi:hypothetical protein
VVVEVVDESVLARRAQGARPRAVAGGAQLREDRLRPPRIATVGIGVWSLSAAGERRTSGVLEALGVCA